jgi:hypothetical protein
MPSIGKSEFYRAQEFCDPSNICNTIETIRVHRDLSLDLRVRDAGPYGLHVPKAASQILPKKKEVAVNLLQRDLRKRHPSPQGTRCPIELHSETILQEILADNHLDIFLQMPHLPKFLQGWHKA